MGIGRLTADDVLTGRDVARLLHAPVSTIEDWARRDILPSVKIGRRRLYIRQQIETALIGQAGGSTELTDPRGPDINRRG